MTASGKKRSSFGLDVSCQDGAIPFRNSMTDPRAW
jgi:hypothetical protein